MGINLSGPPPTLASRGGTKVSSVGEQNGPGVHAEATLTAKPQADTMQHTVLPTMHWLSSVTHMHTHSPLRPGGSRGPARGRPAPTPPAPHSPRSCTVRGPALAPPEAKAQSAATAASDSGQGSAGAEQRLRVGSGRRLHPRSAPPPLRAAPSEGAQAPALPLAAVRHRRRCPATAPHTSIIHRPSPASRAKPITGGGSTNGAAAAEEATSRAPGRKRQPFGDGDGNRGRAGGGGALGAQEKLPTARCAAPRSQTPRA